MKQILKLRICETYSRHETEIKGTSMVKINKKVSPLITSLIHVYHGGHFIYGRKYSLPPISIAFRPKNYFEKYNHQKKVKFLISVISDLERFR